MLYDLRAGEVSGFRDVGYDENGKIAAFAYAHELVAADPDLRYRSRSGVDVGRIHRLDRVDDEKDRIDLFFLQDNIFHVRLRKNIERIWNLFAYPVRPHFDLFLGFFSADVEYLAAAFCDFCGGLEDQSRFSDPRFA